MSARPLAVGVNAVSTIGILGASGYTGRLVVAEAVRRGHRPVAIGRDAQRVRTVLAEQGIDADTGLSGIREADVTAPSSLLEAFDDLDVLLTTVGPFDRLGRSVLDAAIATRTNYVDSTGEQSFMRWAYGERDVAAREAGIVAVPAAGFDHLPGDLLADLAAKAVRWPTEVHVAYTVPPSSGVFPAISAGTRRTAVSTLGRRGIALEHGEMVEEMPAEARRLAWFPRPVGPRHAAGIPGGEPITVPRHVPGVRTVRTYLAVPGWQAEGYQLLSSAARWEPLRRAMRAMLERGDGGPSEARRRATRWGCVAEAEGENGVARAWAYGHDIYHLTSVAMVVVGERLIADWARPGMVPPASVSTPKDLLDLVAARCDLRWSLARPEPDDSLDGGG